MLDNPDSGLVYNSYDLLKQSILKQITVAMNTLKITCYLYIIYFYSNNTYICLFLLGANIYNMTEGFCNFFFMISKPSKPLPWPLDINNVQLDRSVSTVTFE